jgi:hypothetical protein
MRMVGSVQGFGAEGFRVVFRISEVQRCGIWCVERREDVQSGQFVASERGGGAENREQGDPWTKGKS